MSMIKRFYTTNVYEVTDVTGDASFRMGPFFTEQVRIATSNSAFHLRFTTDENSLNELITADSGGKIIIWSIKNGTSICKTILLFLIQLIIIF
jgi:hypothetical protein